MGTGHGGCGAVHVRHATYIAILHEGIGALGYWGVGVLGCWSVGGVMEVYVGDKRGDSNDNECM